ncbi:adenosine 3'-phospho 5'-phosphosulfate transporter 1 isoform X2 [Lycorma delicatula]|uniref:adenosine 3'-phospho 5'-phosphosulfate transporter 1 isoform X2 n=1 Tax=Lycorma delicatula TaxID=130591 RepID=UPI003F515A3B
MTVRQQVPVIIILLLIIITILVVYAVTHVLRFIVDDSFFDGVGIDSSIITNNVDLNHSNNNNNNNKSSNDNFKGSWLFRLSLNLLGYATIFIPGFFIFKYIKTSKYLDRSGPNCFARVIRLCFTGGTTDTGGDRLLPTSDKSESINRTNSGIGVASSVVPISSHSRSTRQDALLLMFCFVGLQGSYLTWGLLQEKVMTQEYDNSAGEVGYFKDSQFLVFVNRILAFILSGIYISLTRQPRHPMPLYKYVFCSFSNIMSSWCQYEALKFISFPTQVLSKACKIIPVMIMGKFVSNQKFEHYEYITGVTISLGMAFFMFGSVQNLKGDETETTFSGVILLAAYILFDSFTSNWQGALFNQYKMSSVQMMCGVNLFSCLFTVVSLAQQGGFSQSINFMTRFPKFIIDCILLSITSAAGQFFIFFTISVFGPVVFVIIMAIRQGLAILLSCIIYQHPVTAIGIIGIVIVFASIFLRIYCKQKLRSLRRKLQNGSSAKVCMLRTAIAALQC